MKNILHIELTNFQNFLLGGVAVINQSFQNIDYNGYEVVAFDTAEKKEREDLYAKLSTIL